ncbi:MAG: C10 family peptidase, partial [Perlucidibaca sp.]
GAYRLPLYSTLPPCPQTPVNPGPQASPFYTGCLTIAVGQLINYHLSQDYGPAWLTRMPVGIEARPRYEMQQNSWLCHLDRTEDVAELPADPSSHYAIAMSHDGSGSDNPEDLRLRRFLWQVALGLDSRFRDPLIAFARYPSDLDRDVPQKLKRMLRDRFSFTVGDPAEGNFDAPRLSDVTSQITTEIDRQQPVLVLFRGTARNGDSVQHAGLIDGYRRRADDGFDFHLNLGWDNRDESNTWYAGEAPVQARGFTFNEFTVLTGIRPRLD